MASLQEVVQDALTTVRLVPRWDLDPDAWSAVADALERMKRAITEGDVAGVRRALADLEVHGPTRLAAIPRSGAPSTDRSQPPDVVLDIVNTLIHPSAAWGGSDGSPSRSPDPGT